ncbi:uncharacterized protein LOC105184940 [Harpegnathos saltator]|uniref:Uncharacterized protein n=1 Tax=Harpegnathos saltator TaxID=610380 RepID=E2BNS8_HARSA|nr:uncharacterized protein LOC105184940 [Harpegnathos saltator]EFN82652.1 hypothetical protein EAI_04820 [Harpegnathos saltator]
MKLLGYCLLLCLFATRVQPKPQITKLFPVEELLTYRQQANNITNQLVDKFLGKLRTTYDLVLRQYNTSHVEKNLIKGTLSPDLQPFRLFWINQIKQDNYTDLQYPNNTFLEHVKSLSVPKDEENKMNTNSLQKEPSIEVKSATKVSANNRSLTSSNQTKTLFDDRLNDVQSLKLLELQDEEVSDARAEVEIVTPGTTVRLSTTVGQHLLEWLSSIFGLTYNIYTKLSTAACSQATH